MEEAAALIRGFPILISLEIFVQGDHRYFLFQGSREVLEFTAERLETAYPKLQVLMTDSDPVEACFQNASIPALGSWMPFKNPDWLPIKTWDSFARENNPVVNLLSSFSGLGPEEGIRNHKILVISTRSGIIGEAITAFNGALFINALAKIVMHQIAHRVKDRTSIPFVVDEMQTIAGVQWDTTLGQMRKHGFSLVIGNQSLTSIRENLGRYPARYGLADLSPGQF